VGEKKGLEFFGGQKVILKFSRKFGENPGVGGLDWKKDWGELQKRDGKSDFH